MIPRFLIAAAWAGLIALDFTGFGPWMISQPLVCGPLFGALMGNIAVGVIVGGIVQLLWMDVTPVGVGIPYDATATTLLAIFWATVQSHPSLSQIVLALFLAVPFGFLFKAMDQLARRLNTRFIRVIDAVPDERLPLALWGGILAGLVWSWVRYFAFYALFLWLGQRAWNLIAYSPRMTWVDQGLTMAVILLPIAGMGVTLELFLSEEPEGRWSSLRHLRGGRHRPGSV